MPGASGASGPALADAGARWADLRLRVISASFLAPAALVCVWAGGWLYGLMLGAAFLGVGWEWGRMCRWRPLPLVLGLCYAAAALFSLAVLRAFGFHVVVLLLLVVWTSDVGAYAVGRVVGGRRLAPRVSPGKTWSGAIGGLLAAIAVGGIWAGFSVSMVAAAATLSIASQLGDLGESALKRWYGVKDSGAIIPGHGGLLDRLDGLMAASIATGLFFVWFYLGMGHIGAAL